MSTQMIQVENLRVQYDDHIVLDDISFSVNKGEIFIILGGSGCGKTSLLRHLIGLETPKKGSITIEDQTLTTASLETRKALLKKIAVAFQSGALFGSMTLLENITLVLEEDTDLPPDLIRAIALNKLKLVGLNGYADYLPAEISGGMRKRAAIARAMALDPDILFLDEPSAGLDPITSAGLDQLIIRLSRLLNITFVIVTHELPSIKAIADRAIILNNKKIVATGTVDELEKNSDTFVQRFFRREAIA